MPKMKTHSGSKKRFKVTGTGKIVRKGAKMNHILGKKSAKLKRRLKEPALVSSAELRRVKRMLVI